MQPASSLVGRARLALFIALSMLAGCSEQEAPDDKTNPVGSPGIARIVPASKVIAGAHIPTLDPATMNDAEILNVLESGPRCQFRYTSAGKPVLAVRAPSSSDAAEGVVKLNGNLVILRSVPADGQLVLTADGIRITLALDFGGQAGASQQETTVVFEVEDRLRVGYRGYYSCIE